MFIAIINDCCKFTRFTANKNTIISFTIIYKVQYHEKKHAFWNHLC